MRRIRRKCGFYRAGCAREVHREKISGQINHPGRASERANERAGGRAGRYRAARPSRGNLLPIFFFLRRKRVGDRIHVPSASRRASLSRGYAARAKRSVAATFNTVTTDPQYRAKQLSSSEPSPSRFRSLGFSVRAIHRGRETASRKSARNFDVGKTRNLERASYI